MGTTIQYIVQQVISATTNVDEIFGQRIYSRQQFFCRSPNSLCTKTWRESTILYQLLDFEQINKKKLLLSTINPQNFTTNKEGQIIYQVKCTTNFPQN